MFTKKMLFVLTLVSGLAMILLVACGQSTPVTQTQEPLAISTTTLPDGQAGIIYSRTLTASGGNGNYSWSVSSGSLPSGLGLDAKTGGITGTCNSAGTYNFTVQVNDGKSTAKQSLSITIKPSLVPLSINTTSLAAQEVGIFYTRTLSASGGSGHYTWSISGGSLPEGLSLNADTGVISGTPKAAGHFGFTVHVDDSAGSQSNQNLNIVIKSLITISNTSLPEGTVGTNYYQSLDNTGGVGNVTWSLPNGSLPDGLTLDAVYGDITGTPKATGKFRFTLQAKDSLGATATRNLELTISPPKS